MLQTYYITNYITNLSSLVVFAPLTLIFHCLFIFLFKRWLGPIGTFYASCLTFTYVLVISIKEMYVVLLTGSYSFVDFGRWFYCLDLLDSHLVFCIDPLALVASILVLSLTLFALYFGVEYMYREAFINRLLYLLNLFSTSVVFLFYCYDYFLILFSWECIGLFSLLLVNFYSVRIYTIKAALKTFIFSRISDMFMFLTFILTVNVFNTTDLTLIFIQTPFYAFHYMFYGQAAVHFLTLFSFCLATSGVVKSAQFFFHVWLPDAMEAPTPASALIHSSTLVVAGVFLVIRFAILFEFTVFTNHYLALLGALTLAFASVTATFQNDIKKLVAYSTISQIGYLVCGCGFCCYEEVLIYLIIHALNKAFLFVLVGYIVHFFSGNTDMRQMGGTYLYSFDITILLSSVCFNLAGLPYSAGFLSKEFLLFQVLRDDFTTLFIRGCWLVSFFFTPVYMFTLIFAVMFGPKKGALVVYSSIWHSNFLLDVQVLLMGFEARVSGSPEKTSQVLLFQAPLYGTRLPLLFGLVRYCFTAITSRLTSYVLFCFWVLFTFYGESLLLVMFNYSTIVDTITSNSFLSLKQHVIFFLTTSPLKLLQLLNFYIGFLTLCGFISLVNLGYTYNYNYFKSSFYSYALMFFLPLAVVVSSSLNIGLLGVPIWVIKAVTNSFTHLEAVQIFYGSEFSCPFTGTTMGIDDLYASSLETIVDVMAIPRFVSIPVPYYFTDTESIVEAPMIPWGYYFIKSSHTLSVYYFMGPCTGTDVLPNLWPGSLGDTLYGVDTGYILPDTSLFTPLVDTIPFLAFGDLCIGGGMGSSDYYIW